jgi:hypothetical protein
MKRFGLILGTVTSCAGLVACASSPSDPQEELVAGFEVPPVPDGYTRYIAPAIHKLQPGEDKMFCQWLDVAPDSDRDMIDLKGYQTVTGHHAVLYSSSENEPVGTSRECTTDDMVSVEYLGGVGGEGGANTGNLPDGVVFRHRKGRTLLVNSHYLNATDKVQDVQSVVDIKTSPPSPDRIAAGMAVINYSDLQIPANTPSYSVDLYCNWPSDTSLITFSDHMHANGKSAFSEVKHADGTIESLASDPSWSPEQSFNPTFNKFDLSAPRKIKAGDQAHVNCTWSNPTGAAIRFPTEMCDSFGFYLESTEQLVCEAAPAT